MQQNKPVIRVTQLEAFRRFLANGDHSWYEITEQSVIDSITGEFKGNCKTRIGTAFHSIVEDCAATTRNEMVANGYIFDIDGYNVALNINHISLALRYRNEHPDAFHEVRMAKDYGRAIVSGCADMIDGLEIRDIKTKFSTPTDADYIDSAQWRFYLDIFGADTFHYDLFVFSGYKDTMEHDVRECTMMRYTPAITCYRYPRMEADNLELVNAFMDWAESRNLTQYLMRNTPIFV